MTSYGNAEQHRGKAAGDSPERVPMVSTGRCRKKMVQSRQRDQDGTGGFSGPYFKQ